MNPKRPGEPGGFTCPPPGPRRIGGGEARLPAVGFHRQLGMGTQPRNVLGCRPSLLKGGSPKGRGGELVGWGAWKFYEYIPLSGRVNSIPWDS